MNLSQTAESVLDTLNKQRLQLPSWAHQATLSTTYPRAYLDAASAEGIEAEAVLQRAGVSPELIANPAGKLTPVTMWKICAAAFLLSQNPLLNWEAGYRMPITAHGNLGYALMCASTPREAIGILERYLHLRGRGVLLMVTDTPEHFLIELLPEHPLFGELSDILIGAILVSMAHSISFVLPSLPEGTELWFSCPAPDNIAHWRQRLPKLCFDMPCNALSLQGDLSVLEQPLPNGNPEALAHALAQCERESRLLAPANNILLRVRNLLRPSTQGYPCPAELATQLCMTPRTLRRRLQTEGYSYQQLLEEARRRDSRQLLRNPRLPVAHIGELLGYTDPANFTRAFKGWYGLSPSGYRATH